MKHQEATETHGPLTGLRVIDLGMLFAGPLIATTLSDMGAEVIKIEHPKGDEVRKLGGAQDADSLWWSVTGRNKKLVAADVSRPEGAEVVRKLIAGADVFIENFRPGRVKEWGLDYDTLSKLNPGLVMVHISGYGQTGPYSRRPGLGTLAEAFSGYAHVTGEADGPPTLPSFPLADGVAAITGTYAVLAALYARSRNGGTGDEIDISLYEPLLNLTGPMVINYTKTGVVSQRAGNRARWSTPRNTYRTRDGRWVAVSGAANSATLRLFSAIGRDDLATHPDYATNQRRMERVDECDAIVANWIAQNDMNTVLEILHANDVLAGPVNDIAAIVDDPHVQARGTLVNVHDPVLGETAVQNVVPRFRNAPAAVRWLGKHEVGADTWELLAEAGYSEADIDSLCESGVIRGERGGSDRAEAPSRLE